MATIEIPFEIGEELWVAEFVETQERVTCEFCGGSKQVGILCHDGSVLPVDCEGCKYDYMPRGFTIKKSWKAIPVSFVPRRFEIRSDGVVYSEAHPQATCWSSRSADDIFRSRDEAEKACKKLALNRAEQERENEARNVAFRKTRQAESAVWWKRKLNELRRDVAVCERKIEEFAAKSREACK